MPQDLAQQHLEAWGIEQELSTLDGSALIFACAPNQEVMVVPSDGTRALL